MIRNLFTIVSFLTIGLLAGCGSKSNKRAVNAEDLDKVMQEEAAMDPTGPTRSSLSATEIIELSQCADIACLQLYMKDKSADFVHAKKGEYASQNRGTVMDSSSNAMIIPFSTLYYENNTGATWRIAHTVHKKELADKLLADFAKKGFQLVDSVRYYATSSRSYRYSSEQFPGQVLYYSPTYTPWYMKGLYLGAKWMSYVFEVRAK